MLAANVVGWLVVLAVMLKDRFCGPVGTGTTGKMLPTLDPMRAVMCWVKIFSLPSNSRLIALSASLSLFSSIGTAPVIAGIRLVFGTGDGSDGKEAARSASSKSSIFALSRSDCFCACSLAWRASSEACLKSSRSSSSSFRSDCYPNYSG